MKSWLFVFLISTQLLAHSLYDEKKKDDEPRPVINNPAKECPPLVFKRIIVDVPKKQDEPRPITLPHGIAIDEKRERLYVADTYGTGNILVTDFSGKVLHSWKFPPPKDQRLSNKPYGMVVDPKTGNLFVGLKSDTHTIVKLSPDGKILSSFGSEGDKPGGFKSLYGMAIGKDGNLYALDAFKAAVHVWSTDGKFIKEVSIKIVKGFNSTEPYGIAVDPNLGDFYISDGRGPVRRFDKDLNLQKGFEDTEKDLALAYGITRDPFGDIYVSDYKAGHILRYTPNGKLKSNLIIPAEEKIGNLAEPRQMVMLGCRLFVCDSQNHRVLEFAPAGK